MIPKAILDDIEEYARPSSEKKIYTQEMIDVMTLCRKKNMDWGSIAVLLKKHYATVNQTLTGSALRGAYHQYHTRNKLEKP